MTHPRPPATVRPVRAAAITMLALLLALGLSACQRRTTFVVIDNDSTRVVPEDSLEAEMRKTQQLWEGGGDIDDAAAASARVLQADLGAHDPTEWPDRAAYVLDSLGVGAELASSRCVLAANFFSRSDPEAGASPYLFWCGRDHVMMQPIEGKSLRLVGVWARGIGDDATGGPAVAALFSKRAPNGTQPLAMTWTMPPRGTKWSLAQTLGADSLGGYGTAQLANVADSSVDLTVRAYRTATGFAECATCPHVYTSSRFHWTPRGFVRVETTPIESPYATFVAFILAVQQGDAATAAQYVTDAGLVAEAERLQWNRSMGAWRPSPGSGESAPQLDVFRGQTEAYQVQFRRQGPAWLITGFAPVERAIE